MIPVIGYEIYHPENKSQLDLNYCKDILVKLNIPVSIDENKEFKYDPNSEYYTDECHAYTTENGTDILLEDRKNEYIDNNLSLCESNCAYKGYNEDSKKAMCECESKTKIGLISDLMNNDNILSNNFSEDNSVSNIISMKCTKTLFTKEGLITNIGSYFLLITFIFFLISIFIFYKCGYQIIENTINEILKLKSRIISKEKRKSKKDILYTDKKYNNSKKKSQKKSKKNKKITSNPQKKKIPQFSKKKNVSKRYLSSQLKFKNTNIIINIGKNKNIDEKFIHETNIIKKENYNLILKYNDFELNFLIFNKALIYDKRTFLQYYYSLLKSNNIILFVFFSTNDYNLKIIKISLAFLSFDIYFIFNSVFYDNETIHKIYEDGGSFNFSYFLPKIIYSFIISYYCIDIIKIFSLSQRNLLELRYEENLNKAQDKADKIKRCLLIKYITFYIICIIFITFFWFYLSSFCAVYKNSQFYVIENTFISFGLSLLYPFLFNLLPSIIRLSSLKSKASLNKHIYKISQFIQLL